MVYQTYSTTSSSGRKEGSSALASCVPISNIESNPTSSTFTIYITYYQLFINKTFLLSYFIIIINIIIFRH